MSKGLFRAGLAGLLACTFVSTASASFTRLQSMGANPLGLSNGRSGQFVEGVVAIDDSTNIFALPGTLALYPSLATMDNLTWNDATGASGMFGFHYALGEYTVMALYGGQGSASLGLSQSPTVGGGATAIAAAGGDAGSGDIPSEGGATDSPSLTGDLWFGALFAHDLGGVRLGLGLNMYSANHTVELPELQSGSASNWSMDVDLGLGLDFETEDSLDFGLGFRFGSFEYTGQTVERPGQPLAFYTPYTNFGFDFTGRGKFALFEGTELIPYGQIAYEMEGVTDEFPLSADGIQPFGDYAHFGLEVGANLKIMPTDKIFIYPGAGFRIDTFSVDNLAGTVQDDSRFTLPFYGFGVDARVWKWFAFRFGARQYVMSDTDGSLTQENNDEGGLLITETSETRRVIETELHTGFGLFFGENDEWRIDAHLSPAFFVKGPYMLSGASTTTPSGAEQMNASVALQYLW